MRKLEIVPIDMLTDSAHKTVAYFDIDMVSTRSTSVDLMQQLIELGCAAGNMALQQPSPQHIGLARGAELLQNRQARWHTCLLQIHQSHVIQNSLGLGRMACTATKCLAKSWKGLF